MRRLEGKSIREMEEEIFGLMKRVYLSSGGEYPALEWVENKALPGKEGWEKEFEDIYRPFLKYRLKEDVDVLFIEEKDRPIGIIGIKYSRTGSFEGYQRLFRHAGLEMPDGAAFLEMLAVDPEFRGMGYGRKLLLSALEFLKEKGMKGYGVSFPGLHPALDLYSSLGAEIIAEVRKYSWGKGDRAAEYLIIKFPEKTNTLN